MRRRWQRLSIYAAVPVGGVIATLPYAGYLLYFRSERVLWDNGWLYLLVALPLWFFGGGALGGAVGWLVGIGRRVRPPRAAEPR